MCGYLKIASLSRISNFIGIARFGNQLVTQTEQSPPAPVPFPQSFLLLAIPTLFNACAHPAHHVLRITKTYIVPTSASVRPQEQRAVSPNKLGKPLHK
jgi:hypothetical protein